MNYSATVAGPQRVHASVGKPIERNQPKLHMNREERLAVLRAWAKEYRCRIVRDECRDEIVLGRHGIIREYNSQLRVIYIPNQKDHNRENYRAKWDNRRAKLEAAGCTILIDAHGEGIALFDPRDGKQSQLAIGVAGVRQKRRISLEQKARLAEIGRAALEANKGTPKAILA